MSPAIVALILQLAPVAISLIERLVTAGLKAHAAQKQGDVTDEEFASAMDEVEAGSRRIAAKIAGLKRLRVQ